MTPDDHPNDQRVEWGVDFRDGQGVQPAPSEWVATRWAAHHNEDQPLAVVMRRVVGETAWAEVDTTEEQR